MVLIPQPLTFEWDKGNQDKNLLAHRVSNTECEEIFFSPQKVLLDDALHSHTEARYILLGVTKVGRKLCLAFTIRKNKIRVISARDLSKKEKKLYEKAIKNTSF